MRSITDGLPPASRPEQKRLMPPSSAWRNNMAKQYSDPEMGRMPNVGQTGLNQAAAANRQPKLPRGPVKVAGPKIVGRPAGNPNMGMMLNGKGVQSVNLGHLGNIGAQGNANSTRAMAPMASRRGASPMRVNPPGAMQKAARGMLPSRLNQRRGMKQAIGKVAARAEKKIKR